MLLPNFKTKFKIYTELLVNKLGPGIGKISVCMNIYYSEHTYISVCIRCMELNCSFFNRNIIISLLMMRLVWLFILFHMFVQLLSEPFSKFYFSGSDLYIYLSDYQKFFNTVQVFLCLCNHYFVSCDFLCRSLRVYYVFMSVDKSSKFDVGKKFCSRKGSFKNFVKDHTLNFDKHSSSGVVVKHVNFYL